MILKNLRVAGKLIATSDDRSIIDLGGVLNYSINEIDRYKLDIDEDGLQIDILVLNYGESIPSSIIRDLRSRCNFKGSSIRISDGIYFETLNNQIISNSKLGLTLVNVIYIGFVEKYGYIIITNHHDDIKLIDLEI